jgi:hypothetical protein
VHRSDCKLPHRFRQHRVNMRRLTLGLGNVVYNVGS